MGSSWGFYFGFYLGSSCFFVSMLLLFGFDVGSIVVRCGFEMAFGWVVWVVFGFNVAFMCEIFGFYLGFIWVKL